MLGVGADEGEPPESGGKSRPAKVGSLVVKVKLRGEHGDVDPERPPLGPFLTALRSRLERDGRRAADLEREVEGVRRLLRNTSDRRRLEDQVKVQQADASKRDAEHAYKQAKKKRTYAEREWAKADRETEELAADAEEQREQVADLTSREGALNKANSELTSQVARAEKTAEERGRTVIVMRDQSGALRKQARSLQKENESLQSMVSEAQAAATAAEASAAAAKEQAATLVNALEQELEQLGEELKELRDWQRERAPAAQRKALEELKARHKRKRHQAARARLALALKDGDLRAQDISAVLEAEGKLDLIFETKELWERKMAFAASICETLQSAWSVDLSVDFHSEFLISQREMDGMRFTLSHEIINGRPRPRVLVTNPHKPKSKLNFPQPLRPRCEWVAREKEREAALGLITTEGVETCERDFDTTLNALVARDEALLTEREYTRAQPFTAVLGFDGADNFTHVTLRLTGYRDDVAAESELKAAQLAVAMGDDHYPNLEKIIEPRIGPAASRVDVVTLHKRSVPAEVVLCLDLSAARSAYGRRHGKPVHYQLEDVQFIPKFKGDDLQGDFGLIDVHFKPNKVADLRRDAHRPTSFPFKCTRKGCKHPVIRDEAHLTALMGELKALKADKTVQGKKDYAAAIKAHADVHGQQRPFEAPVTDLEPWTHLIVDLLHGLDLNIPKVAMKYSILDPALLTPDMREACAEFFSEIGCPLDCRDKNDREKAKKWFHGSVWHYDFMLGANHKSYGLYANIFQLCLIVYGVKVEEPAPPSTTRTPPARKRPAACAIVDDFSDSEGESEDDDDDANLDSDDIDAELTKFFGANAARVKLILKMWNAYADLYNALCDEWKTDLQSERDERAYQVLKSSAALLELLNSVSNWRHKCAYIQMMMTVGAKQVRTRGNLWPFSTRAVEGRGGQLKKIGRRIICWRRRSQGTYKRNIRRLGAARTVVQGYSSAPERQLMRASCFREDRAHTQKRSRMATTGRNTLARSMPKAELAELPALDDVLEPERVKSLCGMKRKRA